MKRRITALLLITILVLSLAACGGSSVPELKMATGGTSGTYYGFSGVIANVLNEKMGDTLTITHESTGASKENVQLVDSKETQIAIIQNDVMSYAYNATDMFQGEEKVQSYSAVMSCYPEIVQIVANKKITSIEELRGKKVSVGDAGSGTEFNARQVLGAYGIDIETDIQKNNQSFGDSVDSIKNGTIDAAFVVAGTPTVAVDELAATYDFNLLSLDDEHIAKLQADYAFYAEVTIPGGTYSKVAEDVKAVAVMATIIAHNDVEEEVIYNFLKGIFDYKADITAGHTKGAEIDLNTAISGIDIPFHPGAMKYYKEVGVK
ncbi:TAXI family TRAP transporter solute-binding subunit [Clostridiaceae bacterium OttesenSCG-928-D20]|nr:TAXI family TRAP transporter solute-binding subunit [Clostridiaceae bacterium OttesenSCG-928-D20]